MSAGGPGPAEWVGVAVLCACAVLSALLELLFVPLYVGATIVPVVVVAGLVGNVLLPRWGFQLARSSAGAVLPVAFWLVTLLVFSLFPRPEGDIFVLAEQGQQWTFYALLLVGAAAGFATVVVITGSSQRGIRPPTNTPVRPPLTQSKSATRRSGRPPS